MLINRLRHHRAKRGSGNKFLHLINKMRLQRVFERVQQNEDRENNERELVFSQRTTITLFSCSNLFIFRVFVIY